LGYLPHLKGRANARGNVGIGEGEGCRDKKLKVKREGKGVVRQGLVRKVGQEGEVPTRKCREWMEGALWGGAGKVRGKAKGEGALIGSFPH